MRKLVIQAAALGIIVISAGQEEDATVTEIAILAMIVVQIFTAHALQVPDLAL